MPTSIIVSPQHISSYIVFLCPSRNYLKIIQAESKEGPGLWRPERSEVTTTGLRDILRASRQLHSNSIHVSAESTEEKKASKTPIAFYNIVSSAATPSHGIAEVLSLGCVIGMSCKVTPSIISSRCV